MKSAAETYYANRSQGISRETLTIWEAEILHAERDRIRDKKVMDILKARPVEIDPAAVPTITQALELGDHSNDIEDWIRMGLDIEERQ